MAKNRLQVNHEGDSIQLSWQRGQATPCFAPAVAFEHPFDEQALKDLRWYLEEYLSFPYGIYPDDAAKIEQKFQDWGQRLFKLVFFSTDEAREFFQEATIEGLEWCEIGIASDNPAVLNLPWELLYSPEHKFLTPLLAGMYRSVSTQAVQAEMGEMPQDKLNILLAIARPYGEQDNLKQFLKDLRGGQSWVLVTSRRKEPWLDCNYKLLALSGLSGQDVEELAAKILQTVGVDRAKLPSEYLDLLKLLGGHPLSLRVILPHLKTQSPTEIMEALRLGLDTFSGAEEEGTEKSLTVSLDYSFAKLSDRARQHLPFLAFFCERVNVDNLHLFSSGSLMDLFGQAYKDVFGEKLQKPDLLRIFNEAAEAGILEHFGENIYIIHPALPEQEYWINALQLYIQTWGVDVQYNQEVVFVREDILNLGRMLKKLGESQFQLVWRYVTSKDCSKAFISVIRTAGEAQGE